MTSRIIIATGLLTLLPLQAPVVHAQGCCGASGTSSVTGVVESGTIFPGTLTLSVFHERFSLGEPISEGHVPVLESDEVANSSVTSIAANLGVTERVTVSAIASYVSRSRNFPLPGTTEGNFIFAGDGIGDVTLLGKFAVKQFGVQSPWEFAVGGGVKFPAGHNAKSGTQGLLPEDVQPGTGATDLLGWTRLFVSRHPYNVAATATVQRAGANHRNYRFGHALSYNVSGGVQLQRGVEIGANLLGRLSGHDRQGSEIVTNTGGHRLYLGPTVAVSPFGHSVTLHGEWLFRVREDINGLQQGLTYAFQLGAEYSLSVF